MESIGEYAFYGCRSIISIKIPKSVKHIGTRAFSHCNLSSIIVEDGNKVYDSREECNAIIETLSNNLISGCKNSIIPKSISKIGDGAFEGCEGLSSVIIPDGVLSIGESAFSFCRSLKSIKIPKSVIEIGKEAFCWSNIEQVQIEGQIEDIKSKVFAYCNIESIVLPNSIRRIDSEAFSDCKLQYLRIPESVDYIESYVFYETKLKVIELPNNIRAIDELAFYHAPLCKVSVPKGRKKYYCKKLSKCLIEDGGTTYDFFDCPTGSYPPRFASKYVIEKD